MSVSDPVPVSIRSSTDPLRVDVLLTESALAERFRQSLDRHVLPEMFFYWLPLSVRAWMALCREAKYRNFARSDALIQAHAGKVAADFIGERIEVVSLGAGQGTKDLHILNAILDGGREAAYRPVDSGQMLLEMACREAIARGASAYGLKADLSDPSHVSALEPSPRDPPRLVMMVGNTLGAFDPLVMLRRLRRLVRPGDMLIIDGELGDDDATLAGYEHPANRDFALAPLRSIGLTETDGTLRFHFSKDVVPGMHRLEKAFFLHDDRTLHVAGEPLHFKAGDCIQMNHSGKFSRRAFLSLFTEATFHVTGEYLSDDSRFLMVSAKPAP